MCRVNLLSSSFLFLIQIFLISIIPTINSISCPALWTQLDDGCFSLYSHDFTLNWEEASEYCEQYNYPSMKAELVSTESIALNKLKKLFPKQTLSYWIGARKVGDKFLDLNSRKIIDEREIHGAATGECIAIWGSSEASGSLAAYSCDVIERPFVCQLVIGPLQELERERRDAVVPEKRGVVVPDCDSYENAPQTICIWVDQVTCDSNPIVASLCARRCCDIGYVSGATEGTTTSGVATSSVATTSSTSIDVTATQSISTATATPEDFGPYCHINRDDIRLLSDLSYFLGYVWNLRECIDLARAIESAFFYAQITPAVAHMNLYECHGVYSSSGTPLNFVASTDYTGCVIQQSTEDTCLHMYPHAIGSGGSYYTIGGVILTTEECFDLAKIICTGSNGITWTADGECFCHDGQLGYEEDIGSTNCFLFHDPQTECGVYEDILEPLECLALATSDLCHLDVYFELCPFTCCVHMLIEGDPLDLVHDRDEVTEDNNDCDGVINSGSMTTAECVEAYMFDRCLEVEPACDYTCCLWQGKSIPSRCRILVDNPDGILPYTGDELAWECLRLCYTEECMGEDGDKHACNLCKYICPYTACLVYDETFTDDFMPVLCHGKTNLMSSAYCEGKAHEMLCAHVGTTHYIGPVNGVYDEECDLSCCLDDIYYTYYKSPSSSTTVATTEAETTSVTPAAVTNSAKKRNVVISVIEKKTGEKSGRHRRGVNETGTDFIIPFPGDLSTDQQKDSTKVVDNATLVVNTTEISGQIQMDEFAPPPEDAWMYQFRRRAARDTSGDDTSPDSSKPSPADGIPEGDYDYLDENTTSNGNNTLSANGASSSVKGFAIHCCQPSIGVIVSSLLIITLFLL